MRTKNAFQPSILREQRVFKRVPEESLRGVHMAMDWIVAFVYAQRAWWTRHYRDTNPKIYDWPAIVTIDTFGLEVEPDLDSKSMLDEAHYTFFELLDSGYDVEEALEELDVQDPDAWRFAETPFRALESVAWPQRSILDAVDNMDSLHAIAAKELEPDDEMAIRLGRQVRTHVAVHPLRVTEAEVAPPWLDSEAAPGLEVEEAARYGYNLVYDVELAIEAAESSAVTVWERQRRARRPMYHGTTWSVIRSAVPGLERVDVPLRPPQTPYDLDLVQESGIGSLWWLSR